MALPWNKGNFRAYTLVVTAQLTTLFLRIFALETLLGSSANILDIEGVIFFHDIVHFITNLQFCVGVVPGREADCGVYPLADCLARSAPHRSYYDFCLD